MRERKYRKTILQGLLLFFIVILSACGKKEPVEVPEMVFGVDYLQEQEIQLPVQIVCDSNNAWIITSVKNDPIRMWSMQTPGTNPELITWLPETGNYDLISIALRQDMLYAELRNREDNTLEIRKFDTEGAWSVVMSVRLENWEDYAIMGRIFYVDSSENVYLVKDNEVTRFEGEEKKANAYELRGDACSFWENKEGIVECVVADETDIILYELKAEGAEEKWILERPETIDNVYIVGDCGGENLCLVADQDILFLDEASGNLSARTDLMKLGMSSVLAGYYDENEGTLKLLGCIGNGEGLCYSLLSKRDETRQQRTELVYGMESGVNNWEKSSIWRAISEFNQTSPDYYVVIKNYDNNIERMHADMAAGNGPDIIDMTHSEYYEFYAKNGYLEDLTSYLEQSQYKEDIIWNILDAYRIDGKLYLLAPQIQLKGVVINPEYEILPEEWNMETFLNLVAQNGWEKPVLAGQAGDSEALLLFLLNGALDIFIDLEQEKSYFETEEFVNMLELCKEYAEMDRSDAMGWTDEEKERNTLCREVRYGGNFSYYLWYGREYHIYGYPTLSGQTYEILSCSDSCAIYSESNQKEGAWAFLESLLSESNQKYSGITEPGFPIRKSVLDELAEESKRMEIKVGGEMQTVTDSEIQILKDILYTGKICNGMMDPSIRSVIQEETEAYFSGDKNAWDVAHIIQSRVDIIIQE